MLWADPAQSDSALAFLSSQQITRTGIGETPLLPTHPEFGLTGFSAPSTIRATKLGTLSRDLPRRWLGRLGPLLIADLDRWWRHSASTRCRTGSTAAATSGLASAPLHRAHRAGGVPALLADLGLATSVQTAGGGSASTRSAEG